MSAPQRIDHLPPERRLKGLGQRLLSPQLDEVLQRIVADAAAQVGTPIALVSLVLDEVQFFRAHHGLPPELAETRATARDMSFCQLAVRDDRMVEIEDAKARADIPQALVDIYGIRAYLGAPIHLEGQPLGSLCVIDTEPRTFTATERAQLEALAGEVDARIQAWSRSESPAPAAAMIRDAVGPIFAEMRNHLSPLMLISDELRILQVELRAHISAVMLAGPAHAVLPDLLRVRRKLTILEDAAGWAEQATAGLLSGIRTAEALVENRPEHGLVADIAERVDVLCKHLTDTVGGIRWVAAPAGLRVALTLSQGALVVASILNRLVLHTRQRQPKGFVATVRSDAQAVVFEFASDVIEAGDAAALVDEALVKTALSQGLTLDGAPGLVRLSLPGA